MDKAPDAFRTISEVAEELAVPQHVLRFWETRFAQIKPMKRGGGRRYYRPDDVDLLRGIRHLLYGEGYTIRGVQRILREQGVKFVQTVWQENAPQPVRRPDDEEEEAESGLAQRKAREEEEGGERGRGLLLGILPALFGHDDEEPRGDASDDDRHEPAFESEAGPVREETESDLRPSGGPARRELRAPEPGQDFGRDLLDFVQPVAARIPHDDLQKLRMVLQELDECRRLIDIAARDEP